MVKLRTSFVSNSSSSSFIITDKDNFDKVKELLKNVYGDYYELDGILYTSPVHDGHDEWQKIWDLSDNKSEEVYPEIEIEGERGVAGVYLPKDKYLASLKIDDNTFKQVYQIVENFMKNNDVLDISCQLGDTNVYNFFNELNKIIFNTNEDLE